MSWTAPNHIIFNSIWSIQHFSRNSLVCCIACSKLTVFISTPSVNNAVFINSCRNISICWNILNITQILFCTANSIRLFTSQNFCRNIICSALYTLTKLSSAVCAKSPYITLRIKSKQVVIAVSNLQNCCLFIMTVLVAHYLCRYGIVRHLPYCTADTQSVVTAYL